MRRKIVAILKTSAGMSRCKWSASRISSACAKNRDAPFPVPVTEPFVGHTDTAVKLDTFAADEMKDIIEFGFGKTGQFGEVVGVVINGGQSFIDD